ncbi:MAG: alpha/beta fold hydrolase [Fimbriimonadales bacterium]|nr:alpha/beta fold hydrolase [Fimbriimonadales bacterium]
MRNGWRISTLGWSIMALTLASCTQAQNSASKYDADLIFGYDKTLPLSPQETLAEETAQYQVYKVTYRSARDQRVPAFLILPKNRGEEKLPCVILMHGLGGDKRMFQMLWGPLTQAGYALFAIDAQYHGERRPNDDIPFFGMYPYRARDALIQTVVDLRRGVDYLQARKEIDPDKIGYIGASMGGIIGSMFAGVDERVKAPVLLVAGGDWKILMEKSTLSMWRDAAKNNPKQMEEALRVMDVVDPVNWVGRIAPRPVLFINGDADDVVPVESNKALQTAAREPKKVVWYRGGHVPPPSDWFTVIGEVTRWLDTHLKGKQSASGWRSWLPRVRSWREFTDWAVSYAPLVGAFFREFAASLRAQLSPMLR